MASTKLRGNQLLLNLGGGKLGCLTSVTANLEREIIEASCREMGNFTGGVKGRLSGSIDFDGLMIVDDPVVVGSMRHQEMVDIMLDDTAVEVPYVFGPGVASEGDVAEIGDPGDLPGSKVLSGFAIMSNFSMTGSQDGEATYSGTLTMTTKPTHAVAL